MMLSCYSGPLCGVWLCVVSTLFWLNIRLSDLLYATKHFHQSVGVTQLIYTGRKEAGTGEHLITFNNKINKHKWKAAAPHGRLPHTKHKQKFQAWSSLVFHCCHSSFNPSEAPPWDSRPVSGAGVVHYHLLHRPRSVPTALGPAPLVTVGYMDCISVLFQA